MGLIISIIRHNQKYITNSKILYPFSIQGLTFQYKKNYSKSLKNILSLGFYHKDPITLHKYPTVQNYKTGH